MKIIVVTGASSGIGKQFAIKLTQDTPCDEIWALARNEESLSLLAYEIKIPVRVIPCDLTTEEGMQTYCALLNEHLPDVHVLVNAAGFGRFGSYGDIPVTDAQQIIDLNCSALVNMTMNTLPYMRQGSTIIQIGSISGNQPLPYLNLYSASKAFVNSFSRALNVELEDRGIHCAVVTPGWASTGFFETAQKTNKNAVTRFPDMHTPEFIVEKALRDIAKGKDISRPGALTKLQVLAAKIVPVRTAMSTWLRQQRH